MNEADSKKRIEELEKSTRDMVSEVHRTISELFEMTQERDTLKAELGGLTDRLNLCREQHIKLNAQCESLMDELCGAKAQSSYKVASEWRDKFHEAERVNSMMGDDMAKQELERVTLKSVLLPSIVVRESQHDH